jgi:hypothetical protein
MPNPVADPIITEWQNDLFGADSNRPITGTDYMNQGSPEDLAANQRVWRATFREEGVNKGWERWLNLNTPQSPNPAPPVYASPNSFTLTGDWVDPGANYPAIAVVGRRIKATVTAGTVYGTITSATFAGADTLVVCLMDVGALDAGLSEVQFGILAAALPGNVETQSNAPTFTTITNGGAGTAFTGALTPAITAYVKGKLYAFLWTQASQGGDTINLNGIGAVPVEFWLGGVLTPTAGAVVGPPATPATIPAGAIGVFLYDGTSFDLQTVFELEIPNGSITTAMIAANAITNWAKASLGVPVTIGAGGSSSYDTWVTILSVSLTVVNPADLCQIFSTLNGVVAKMAQLDEFDFQIVDQSANILVGPNPNINQIATVSGFAFGGLYIGSVFTPGAAGVNTFSLQIKVHNGSSNGTFAVTINTIKLWVSEFLR